MIRKVIKAEHEFISLQLPKHFVGKKIEVIVFTIEEAHAVSESKSGKDPTATHFATEAILAKDWLNSSEDEAWKDL